MRCKHQRGYQGCFIRLASRYRSLFTLVWIFLALLSVPGFNGFAHAQSATHRGTEEGTGFSLNNAATSPRGTITSIQGTGKFSNEPIASLTFTRQSVTPEITSAATFTVDEGTTAVETLTAEDQDSAAADLEWSKAGGADAGQFTLSTAGDLAFAAAPDYENPGDADGDNVYEVTVQVREGTNTATADIEVTVVNVDEAGSVSLFPALLQVRTVVRPTLSDPDGGISAVAWQWARSSDKMTWADIDRAVRADYLPTDSDQGQYLRATASYTDGEGADKTAVAASEAMVGKREPGPELSVKTLVSGLKHPWGIAFLPDETMLFGERDEKLMVRLTDGTVRDLTADLSDRNLDHNNGLMGIVVDPDFTTNRRFYTCMSHTGSVVQVIVWELDATYTTATRVVDPLVDGIPSGRGHNGCRLRFGPDGYLWISTGDTEVIGTTPQDLDSLGGKVLRVNAAGVPPADNPFSDSPVYSYGHRNPQGLALRPGTRQMWVVEHGPDWDDEINLLASGANYGWEPVPTNEMGEPQAGYDDTRPMTDLLKFPSAVEARWSSGYPTIATSGAIFLEGERWGIWEGRLAVATLKNRSLHLFEFSEDGNVLSHVIPPELDHTHDRLRTPMLGPDDALYISTSNGRHRDLILRLTPQQAPEFASDTAAFEVPENTDGTTPVATVEATDYNHDELTYTLGGTDVKSFYILDENIGELRVPSTTQLDFETKRTYEVTVTATDDQNTSDTVTLTIEVTDVEHEGTVTLSSTQPQVDSPFQASLSDPDGGVTATTWKWERSDDGVTGWEDIDGARSASYTPVADDAGKYLRATVTYTNTHGPGKTAQSVTSSAVGAAPNSNPEFPSASLVRRVAEHTAAGQPFDSPVEADDADGDPLQYALSGMDADLFDIDSSTGQLLTKAALDYEVVNEYEVVVSVSDGKDTNDVADDNEGDDSVTVPIKVINVDEPGSVSLFPSQLRVRTVVRATLTDPDGDLSAVSWRWAESSDKTNWTNIDGATEADYLPTEATQGKYLRAKATSYGDGEGSGKTAQTESNAVVGEREPAPEPTVVAFVSGLSVPWGMTFAPDGTMLFTERGGRLSSRLTDGTVQPVSADFDDLLVSGEAGLMAIAADPAFASNRRFYTCQAHTGPEVQVIAWTFNDDTYTAATRVADPLVGNIPAASRHSGCRLRFGPQRYLWIATGDATVGTAPQDLNSLGGKVLRVDAATGAAAAGNPFGSRLYTYGHRNVQGLARRPGTNQMWSVEHGPRLDDEINLLSAGGNYGWDPVPGYDEGVPMTDLVKFPGAVEARWSSGNPTLATSGGIFLEGAQWGRWDGRLAVATLKGSSLRLFEFTDDGAFVSQVVVPELDGRYGRLRTPLLGPDGALYVTTSNGRGQDKILRVSGSRAPAFLTDTETRNVDENNNISTFVAKVLALDSDGDTLTYTLSGPDAESFSIPDAAVGAMWVNVAFDYETKRSYEVTVTATDPQGLNDSTTLTITVTDTDEPPDAPGAPSVSSASVTSLSVTWSAPANAGPAITDYDYRYRTTLPEGNWTEITDTTSTALSATIGSLAENTSYDVQVRATNDEGTGDWSASGSGATDADPLFDPPALDVAMVKGAELELRFDRPLDESSVPAPEDFTVVLDDGAGTPLPGVGRYAGSGAGGRPLAASAAGVRGTTLAVTAVAVRGAAVVLTLEREVPHGMRVTVSYTPGAAPLQDRQGMAVPPLGNEAAVETALSVVDALADEGDAVRFPVRLSRAVASPVTVAWTLTPGSAAPDTDYTGPLAGSLTIEGGETAGVIAVPTAEDAVVESAETFTLTLTEPADFPHWALLKTATATGTIRDDDFDTGGTSGGGSGGSGGGSGGSRDRPPVATEEIGVQVLERGASVTLDALQHFRDPERRALTFTAESADPDVATVTVDGAAVTVAGVEHGHTRVTLTATDRRRQQATQEFAVRVGPDGVVRGCAGVGAGGRHGGADGDHRPGAGRAGDAVLCGGRRCRPGDGGRGRGGPRRPGRHGDDRGRRDGGVARHRGLRRCGHRGAARDVRGDAAAHGGTGGTVRSGRGDGAGDDHGGGVRPHRAGAQYAAPLAAVRGGVGGGPGGAGEVDLAARGIAALRGRDLSGLTGLRVLDLSENLLTALPAGVFEGLGPLDELQLQDNPGAPFALTVHLSRVDADVSAPGPARVLAGVAEGAPLALRVAVAATHATLSSDAVHLAAGALASAPLTVTGAGTGAARLTATAPALPDTRCGLLGLYRCYRGVTLTAGATLVLFKAPPRATGEPPRAELGTDGDALRIHLSDLFAASDGGALTYAARSSDTGLVAVHVTGGVLTVASTPDGADGAATVTVTATDADGLSVTRTFEVTVEPMPAGFMRGWRRLLLTRPAPAERD